MRCSFPNIDVQVTYNSSVLEGESSVVCVKFNSSSMLVRTIPGTADGEQSRAHEILKFKSSCTTYLCRD